MVRQKPAGHSDGLEIACWNGEVVRVAFALDTCDREVIAWCAGTGGISGEMIRDLMVESVERRFGLGGLPHPIQWLSDNASCYRAHETIEFATRLGLVPCFTPVRSPQSNGMAEAFVKTFKRDYVSPCCAPEKKNPRRLSPSGVRLRFKSLAVTYFHIDKVDTSIGAERFHFRVRKGIGWFPLAMAARQTGRNGRVMARPPLIRTICFDACRNSSQFPNHALPR